MAQGDGISIITGHGSLEKDDVFLLCTDGLNQFAEFKDMEKCAADIWDTNSGNFMESFFKYLENDLVKTDQAKDNVTFMLVTGDINNE